MLEEIDVHACDKLDSGDDHALKIFVVGKEEVHARCCRAGKVDSVGGSDLAIGSNSRIVIGSVIGERENIHIGWLQEVS